MAWLTAASEIPEIQDKTATFQPLGLAWYMDLPALKVIKNKILPKFSARRQAKYIFTPKSKGGIPVMTPVNIQGGAN